MAVPKHYRGDVDAVLAHRRDQGHDFWATKDKRWGKGSPFSTLDCILTLTELGVPRSDPVLRGAADVLLASWRDDGRFRPAPKGSVYPCHVANAARALCRLGYARDRRLRKTFEHLFADQHDDGGWRCNRTKLGRSPVTDASNPGVTLYALDAFRFTEHGNNDSRLDKAVRTLLDHWQTRAPLGPCQFGIGSRFLQIEFPFLRYNLFFWVYVLSFYDKARQDRRFKQALAALQSKMEDDQIVVESPNRGLSQLSFCAKGERSRAATKRYRELLANLER